MVADFTTVTQEAYKYPSEIPILFKPCQPPSPDPDIPERTPPPPPPCDCEAAHSSARNPKITQYARLADRQRQLCDDYRMLQNKMVGLTNEILDDQCQDIDTSMATLYNTDFQLRGYPSSPYRAMRAAADSPAGVGAAARIPCSLPADPTKFLRTPVPRPPAARVEPPRDITLGVTPASADFFTLAWPPRTEYASSYSARALATWRATQRYKQPAPSSRRREDDPCI